jgi:hypothetical protein
MLDSGEDKRRNNMLDTAFVDTAVDGVLTTTKSIFTTKIKTVSAAAVGP